MAARPPIAAPDRTAAPSRGLDRTGPLVRHCGVDFIDRPSPNFDDRALPVTMVVLHYTGKPDCSGAMDRMTSAEAKVSAHYCIDEDGTTYRLVPEEKRAWHAGKSHWRGISDINSASVGIEIVNPGHEFGYREFPDEQIAALIPLLSSIKERHGIGRGNIVGHSDIAPTRKEDPGELFPWEALARYRLALPSPKRDLIDPYWTDAAFLLALERFGYDVTDGAKAVIAFQRRFRPNLIDGVIDGECRAKLLSLLLPRPQ
jgi:N-acetylmuramoyl-L-alanine amidase